MGNDPNSRQKSQMKKTNSSQNIHNERDLNSSLNSQRTTISQQNSINKINNRLSRTQPLYNKTNIINNNIKNSNINNINYNNNSNNDNNNNIHYNSNSNNKSSNDNNHNNSSNNNSNFSNKKIDNYTFIKDLGKGTTGKVSLYRSNLNQQLVAIKRN